MLFQDFFPRMIKYTAATRITPIRMYMASVMGRFLLHEIFSISIARVHGRIKAPVDEAIPVQERLDLDIHFD
jgi:hypothetical protein